MKALRVIDVAMAEASVAGIGRLTLSRRERMVMVEPRGAGMALFTLRVADEVRLSLFGTAEGDVDTEMVLSPARSSRDGRGISIRQPFETAIKRPYER